MDIAWFRYLLVSALSLTMALTAAPVAANQRAHVVQTRDQLIKPLLATKVGNAVCFSGTFKGAKVNVWDYSKSKLVPVPGLIQFGEPVMRPEPHVYVGQELRSMVLVLEHDRHEDWDEMHDFRLQITLKDWKAPLQAAGECPLRLRTRPNPGDGGPTVVNTTALWCGIDCDGGAIEVERVPGKGDVTFRFDASVGGLRMSQGCSDSEDYRVGGVAKPFEEQPVKAPEPTSYRLSPMPAEACAAYRNAIDR